MLWKGPPQQTLFFSSVHDGIYRLGKGHICMLSSASRGLGDVYKRQRFLAAVRIETVLVHFLEWPAENSREMVP